MPEFNRKMQAMKKKKRSKAGVNLLKSMVGDNAAADLLFTNRKITPSSGPEIILDPVEQRNKIKKAAL
jgi:hypothetical protein